MAFKWQKQALEETVETYADLFGTVTLDGTGTETDVVFADEGVPDMALTAYQVFLTAADAIDVNVLAASKATTGFTIEHDDASTATVDVLVKGRII